MLSFYDPSWMNEYSINLTRRKAKEGITIVYTILWNLALCCTHNLFIQIKWIIEILIVNCWI
jgi:hypothetical protein